MNYTNNKIQLKTFNHFGDFYFYTTPAHVKKYLRISKSTKKFEEFLEKHSLVENRKFYEWLCTGKFQISDSEV